MEDEVALFNDSLERRMGRPEFLDRFDELFLSRRRRKWQRIRPYRLREAKAPRSSPLYMPWWRAKVTAAATPV
jgi:hypothetical protein